MKKINILFLTICATLALNSVYAQAQLALGLKGGLNFSSVNSSNTTSFASAYDSRTGYHSGAYLLVKLTKIGIQPEILFSQQGHTFTFNSQNYKSNYNYICIPVILKLYLAGGFNLQTGVQFGFLSSATGDLINTSTGAVSTGQDLKNFVSSTDFSIPVGFGWDLPFGLNFAARYNIGISDINKYTGTSSPTTVSSLGTTQAKSQTIQISVGYRLFKFGK